MTGIDLSLLDEGDLGIEALPEANALGCWCTASCGSTASCPASTASCVSSASTFG